MYSMPVLQEQKTGDVQDVLYAGFASLQGKGCSYNPVAFPPSMAVM